ncbi:polysaccharide deacetylase family protein [Sulfitobacter sp. JB4-11]|uniref:polysaccharide deacetylase family protein n=1 Tax=Sulfitobacter rhodophyticola TaxID=3238304 RepID=UPI003D81496F
MVIDWTELRAELAVWRRQARHLPIWWRDDDAVSATAALERLIGLSDELQVPLHLAIIPVMADSSLADLLKKQPRVVPMVHGWAHQNHAPEGKKKAEFGHPRETATPELAMAYARLKDLLAFENDMFFVPPWNRIDASVVSALPAAGYAGVSTFTPRNAACPMPGLVQINTHLDPIYWRGGGGVVPADQLISALVALLQDRRAGRTDATEPLGILTHHLVHDADIWAFTRAVLSELLAGGAIPATVRGAR